MGLLTDAKKLQKYNRNNEAKETRRSEVLCVLFITAVHIENIHMCRERESCGSVCAKEKNMRAP